jgi:hypothetical protein
MKNALKQAGKVAAGLLPAAFLAGLGTPALAALVFLAVLILGKICWIIGSGDRSDRVTRMILARWGDASCLAPATAAAALSISRRRRQPGAPPGCPLHEEGRPSGLRRGRSKLRDMLYASGPAFRRVP